jgi:hypothetical protein
LSPKKPKAQKVRMQEWRLGTMLTAFFCAKCIIHREFVPERQTVNAKFYKEMIKRFVAVFYRYRPKFQERGSWYLLHDNALAPFFGNCLIVFGETREPRVMSSTLLPWLSAGCLFLIS